MRKRGSKWRFNCYESTKYIYKYIHFYTYQPPWVSAAAIRSLEGAQTGPPVRYNYVADLAARKNIVWWCRYEDLFMRQTFGNALIREKCVTIGRKHCLRLKKGRDATTSLMKSMIWERSKFGNNRIELLRSIDFNSGECLFCNCW